MKKRPRWTSPICNLLGFKNEMSEIMKNSGLFEDEEEEFPDTKNGESNEEEEEDRKPAAEEYMFKDLLDQGYSI